MERKGFYKSAKFPQRTCEFFTAENGLISEKASCLGYSEDGTVYIGTDCGLSYTKKDGTFGNFPCGNVSRIYSDGEKVYFSCEKTLYVAEDGKITEFQTFPEEITGISGNSDVFVITADYLYKLEGDEFTVLTNTELSPKGLSASNGNIVAFDGRSFMIFAGKRKHWQCVFPEHSTMPEFNINSVTFDDTVGFVWVGTDKGVYIFDNHTNWYGHKEINCLPEEAVYNIRFNNKGKALVSTEAGLVIVSNGESKYLPAKRWCCEEKVNDAIFAGDTIWTATDSGVSKITEEELTLEEKANRYFEITEKYYIRQPGFCTDLRSVKNCDYTTGVPAITDNDGLWTQTYLASLAFCYAVTKDEKVLEAARRSMNACAILTKVTGIKGFTARAVRYEGDPGYGKDLDMQIDGGEWHKAPDGSCEWLGETSSDEMTGHFFGFSAYYDFCADEKEKEFIKEIICDIVDHILSHNYRLCDIDGLPTTWACWTPSELNGKNLWMWEKCINSLEILTFLTVAYHVSGDEKYRKEFLRLAIDEHYLLNAAQHKKHDGRVTHIDDNLGFLCSLTILRLEQDPQIRSYILMGLRHHWNYERDEHSAMFNFVFGAFTDDVCDIDEAVKTLRDMPLNMTNFEYLNNKRKNLVFDTQQEYWGGGRQLKKALPMDERMPHNYDTNPYPASGGRPTVATSPSCYMLPYWFARYYGLIDG